MKKLLGCVVMSIGFMIFSAATVGAGEVTGELASNPWQFTIEPYMWAFQLSGAVTVKGKQEKVKLDLTDYPTIIDELKLLLSGRFTIQKGRFGVFYDGNYLKLRDKFNGRMVSATVILRQGIEELGGMFRAANWAVGKENKKNLSLDLLCGARHVYLRGEGSATVPMLGVSLEADRTRQWVDPFIGGRLTLGLTKKTSISLRGDVGGFGVSSNFIWNGLVEVRHYFKKNWFVSVGYRGMNTDYEKGSFKYKVNYFGPATSVGFTF